VNVFAIFFVFYVFFLSDAVNVTCAPTQEMVILGKGKGRKKKASKGSKNSSVVMKMKGMIQMTTTVTKCNE